VRLVVSKDSAVNSAAPPILVMGDPRACRKLGQVRQRQRYKIVEAQMKTPKNLGMILLAIFLVLFGLLSNSLLGIKFTYSGDVLAALAIAAGVLLFMQR
jgi:hypothetical protein